MKTRQSSQIGRAIAVSALALLSACKQSATETQPTQQTQAEQATAPVQTANYTYTGTCDGSAAARLPDGRIVIGNDEDSVLRVYQLTGGAPVAQPDLRTALKLVSEKGEADIEAAAAADGRIYWITSHGFNSDGELELDRYRFFATAPKASGLELPTAFRDDLLKDPKFPQFGNTKANELKPEEGGWNIEALAPGPNGSLLVGFRSPLTGGLTGSAVVVPLANPAAILARKDEPPVFGAPIEIDLSNRGIRDMIPFGGRYLLLAGTVNGESRFDLYVWDGPAGSAAPRKLTADLSGLNPEALVDLGGGRVLVLSDEGDTKLPQYGDKKCKNKNVEPAKRSFSGRVIPVAI